MNQTAASYPPGVSEIDANKIETLPSIYVKSPRVKFSPINLECKYIKKVDLPVGNANASNKVIFGEVLGIHIKDTIIIDGKIDYKSLQTIARLGYSEYALISEIFEMQRATLT
jgi:flavin reductase (DIM6/NTAB) family NADH-FMN oxidoreductase RutF